MWQAPAPLSTREGDGREEEEDEDRVFLKWPMGDFGRFGNSLAFMGQNGHGFLWPYFLQIAN